MSLLFADDPGMLDYETSLACFIRSVLHSECRDAHTRQHSRRGEHFQSCEFTSSTCARRNQSTIDSAITLELATSFYPAKFVLRVAQEAIDLGVEISTNTNVIRVDRDECDGRLTVHTDRGSLTCDKIIYATNAWTLNWFQS